MSIDRRRIEPNDYYLTRLPVGRPNIVIANDLRRIGGVSGATVLIVSAAVTFTALAVLPDARPASEPRLIVPRPAPPVAADADEATPTPPTASDLAQRAEEQRRQARRAAARQRRGAQRLRRIRREARAHARAQREALVDQLRRRRNSVPRAPAPGRPGPAQPLQPTGTSTTRTTPSSPNTTTTAPKNASPNTAPKPRGASGPG